MVFMDGYRIFESDLLSLPSHMTITHKHNAPQDVYMHSPAWCGSSLTEDAGIIHSTYTQQRQVRWAMIHQQCACFQHVWDKSPANNTCKRTSKIKHLVVFLTNYDPCTHDQSLKEARAPVKGVPQHIIQCQQCPWSLYPLEVIRFSVRQSQIWVTSDVDFWSS